MEAKRIYQNNQHANFAVKCAYGVLLVDIAIFLQQHIPRIHQYNPHTLHQPPLNPATQEASLPILDQIQQCVMLGIPDAFALQRIYWIFEHIGVILL
jgi:hypothetical protein